VKRISSSFLCSKLTSGETAMSQTREEMLLVLMKSEDPNKIRFHWRHTRWMEKFL
jgi:hypothetical protein